MTLSARVPLAMVLACLPMTAFGQQPSPEPSASPTPPAVSEYVEVTATRIPEPPDEVPAPIEVFSGDELRARGASDLRSALSLAAGVDIAPGGDGGPASSVPEFWGLKEFDAFLLVVDGVPWGGAFNPALSTLDLEDVERIEVLRGAAPVMYGATSFVGVIQVVHRHAGTTKNLLSVGGGSYGSFGGSLNSKLPQWAGFDSSLSVDGLKQGFKDDRTAFRRGHLLWRNSKKWGHSAFRFDINGTLLDQDPASPHPREGQTLTPLVPIDTNHNPDGAFLNDRRLAVNLGYDKPVGHTTWTTTLSFARAKQDIYRGFLDGVSEADPNAHGLREEIHTTDIYFDTHFAWIASPTIRVVTGLDHLHGKGDADGADFDYHVDLDGSNLEPVIAPTDLDVTIEDRREFSGLYAFTEWNPASSLRLEGGLRLNRTSEEREMRDPAEPAPPAEGEEGENNHVRLSGSAGVSYTPWARGADRLRFFAAYRNTFKPAAIDFGIGEAEGGGEAEGEGILDPETSQSFELGAKTRLLDNRLSIEVSSFLMDMDNLVVAGEVNGLPALVNAGTQRFKGIETAVSWRLPSHVSARATYSFHDAKFTNFVQEFDGVPTQLGGKRLEMSARHLASGGLLYAPARGLLALFEVQYVGTRYLNKRNTALADSYATIAAGVGYRWPRFELRVDGRNLNDKRDPVAESELGDAQYYLLPAWRIDVRGAFRF